MLFDAVTRRSQIHRHETLESKANNDSDWHTMAENRGEVNSHGGRADVVVEDW